jgi:organic hydroperoxide reductase OsmC/OhrA
LHAGRWPFAQNTSITGSRSTRTKRAALARCSISSLEHFADQKGIEVHASAYASGTVTRREADDRYGFVDIECKLDARIEPEPPEDELRTLLQSAEWGCFIGASLKPAPRYRWRVNGRDL